MFSWWRIRAKVLFSVERPVQPLHSLMNDPIQSQLKLLWVLFQFSRNEITVCFFTVLKRDVAVLQPHLRTRGQSLWRYLSLSTIHTCTRSEEMSFPRASMTVLIDGLTIIRMCVSVVTTFETRLVSVRLLSTCGLVPVGYSATTSPRNPPRPRGDDCPR